MRCSRTASVVATFVASSGHVLFVDANVNLLVACVNYPRCSRHPTNADLSAYVLAQERERALPCEPGRLGVVALALIAVEAVLGVVEEELRFRMRCGEMPRARHRDRGIALAEMRHERALGLLAPSLEDSAAVVRDRAGESGQPGSAHPGDESTPAVYDNADATGGSDGVGRRRDIGQRHLGGGSGLELATARDILRRVTDIEVALIAIEQRRRDGHVTIGREAAADAADVAVDAEDLLGNDQSPAWLALPRRIGTIRRQPKPVGGGQLHPLAHRSFLLEVPGSLRALCYGRLRSDRLHGIIAGLLVFHGACE